MVHIEIKLEQTHVQKLSAKMEQSVRILQMDAQDLERYLNDIMLENPLIEMDPPAADPQVQAASPWSGHSFRSRSAFSGSPGEAVKSLIENLPSQEAGANLANHLLQQIRLHYSGRTAQCLRYLVSFLDENGYFRPSFDQICRYQVFAPNELQAALACLRTLDPPGIGASSLSECLCLQLKKEDLLARELVTNHLDQIAYGSIASLAQTLHVPQKQVAQAVDRIKRLSPKPGAVHSAAPEVVYVVPDIYVTRGESGFEVVIAQNASPEIRPCKQYLELADSTDDPELRAYLKTKLDQLNWLQTCLENRNRTLQRLAEVIVRHQSRFFKYGTAFLNTFRMKDAAALLHVHESTISRAVKDKYLYCEHGTFPLRYFFVRSVQRNTPNVSVSDAKRELLRIIALEPAGAACSDRALAEKMSKAGIPISRRTVAKYRTELEIASSTVRARL